MIPTFVTRTLPSAWILLEATRANVNQDITKATPTKPVVRSVFFVKCNYKQRRFNKRKNIENTSTRNASKMKHIPRAIYTQYNKQWWMVWTQGVSDICLAWSFGWMSSLERLLLVTDVSTTWAVVSFEVMYVRSVVCKVQSVQRFLFWVCVPAFKCQSLLVVCAVSDTFSRIPVAIDIVFS